MPVAEMLSRMSSAELTEWMAYEQVAGPLGPERGDQLVAMLASVVANANRAKGRKAKPKDFLPQWDRRREQSWQEQLAAVKQINKALHGTTKRRPA